MNNDNVIGLNVSSTKLASLPTGTTLASANTRKSVDTDPNNGMQEIYVVGKSLSTMGSSASKTANQNALRYFDGDGAQQYWNPDAGFTIQSILESSNMVKVYANDASSAGGLKEYSFVRDDGVDTAGWNLEGEVLTLQAPEVVALEVSTYRNLNGDVANSKPIIGLKYEAANAADPAITLNGMYKGTVGDKAYYFAGRASSGIAARTTPFAIDLPNLLKDSEGAALAIDDDYVDFGPAGSAGGVPETAT